MSTDDLREKLAEEVAAAVYPDGSGSPRTVGVQRLTDALLPIIDAHTAAAVVEAREQIAARLEAQVSPRESDTPELAGTRAGCYLVAAEIARGQA